MGVDTERQKSKFLKPLMAKQKFRAGVFVVIAAIRMSRLEEQWREKKVLGEGLRQMKMKAVGGKDTVR